MFDHIGKITKVIPCKVNPEREFIFAEKMSGHIGIRSIDYHSRWWKKEKQIVAEIEQLETQLEFWRELLEVFRRHNVS